MSQYQFPLHKSHNDGLRIEASLSGVKTATNYLNHNTALNTQIMLNFTYRFSSYRKENTPNLHYKNQSVNAV
jgi:hypothetical protein